MIIFTKDGKEELNGALRTRSQSHAPWKSLCRSLLSIAAVSSAIFLTHSPQASARELEGRVGIGYNSEFANAYPASTTAGGFRFPGISVKYGLTRDIAVAAIAGLATTSPSNMVVAMKVFKNIFYENHLNFYFTAGAGILSVNNSSGIEVLGAVGVEFFIPGVESLGLSVETGATFDNASGSFAIKTLGVSFLDAGIHFYF